jgi:hypothetical protein
MSNPLHHYIRKLSDSIVKAAGEGTPSTPSKSTVWGVVVSITAGPPKTVIIALQGSSVRTGQLRYHNSYSPTVGDTVKCDWYGTDLVVEDKLA